MPFKISFKFTIALLCFFYKLSMFYFKLLCYGVVYVIYYLVKIKFWTKMHCTTSLDYELYE